MDTNLAFNSFVSPGSIDTCHKKCPPARAKFNANATNELLAQLPNYANKGTNDYLTYYT